ncbi:MBL fold metallo-hydrolase [bacterium]|nr:MBL fold metallo-hydrolase [bacterium]
MFELTPAELKARLDRQEAIALLDVRNADEYEAWRIESKHGFPMAHVPYFDFIEDAEVAIASLPFSREQEIVVVCAKGGSSEFVAEMLREAGYNALNMAQGMQGWGDLYEVREVVPSSDRLTLLQFNRVGKGCLSYLVGSGQEAIVVDPGRHVGQYLEEAQKRGLSITHVVDTHVHADHVSGAPELAAVTGAPYHLHEADASFGKLEVATGEGQIRLGELVVDVLQEHTPGHTPGSTSLVVDERFLIAGDTLFVKSVGRPDLGGHAEEWAHDLYQTLVEKIRRLGDDTTVLPGHYASLDEIRDDGIVSGELGEIRQNNPALQLEDAKAFVAFIQENMRPQPELYGEIRRVNLGLVEACEDQRTALEIGKNQCAASKAIV